MRACYEITKRLSAEFCIRYFLIQYRDRCLERLAEWVTDPNPHVRRLVSEGTRPRLPWAMRLKDFQQNPHYTLPLLEQLKDDRELYVRRSVANHLGDLLKDHPDVMFDVCQRWADEVSGPSVDLPASVIAARRWLVRHAVRLPAKKGDARAIAVRDTAEPVRKSS